HGDDGDDGGDALGDQAAAGQPDGVEEVLEADGHVNGLGEDELAHGSDLLVGVGGGAADGEQVAHRVHGGIADLGAGPGSVDHPSISDVNADVVNVRGAGAVEDEVSRADLAGLDGLGRRILCGGRARQGDSRFRVGVQREPGAVETADGFPVLAAGGAARSRAGSVCVSSTPRVRGAQHLLCRVDRGCGLPGVCRLPAALVLVGESGDGPDVVLCFLVRGNSAVFLYGAAARVVGGQHVVLLVPGDVFDVLGDGAEVFGG